MSFFQDFIEKVEGQMAVTNDIARQVGGNRTQPIEMVTDTGEIYTTTLAEADASISPFRWVATLMRKAKIVRMRGEQAQVFLDTPEVQGQDHAKWLRCIFPTLYLHIDGELQFTGYTDGIADEIRQLESPDIALQLDEGRTPGEALAARKQEADRLRRIQNEKNPPVKGVVIHELDLSAEFLRWDSGVEKALVDGALQGAAADPQSLDQVKRQMAADLVERRINALEGEIEQAGPQDDRSLTGIGVGYSVPSQGVTPLRVPYSRADVERIINVTFLLPVPSFLMNLHGCSLIVLKNGQLLTSINSQMGVREKMRRWVIHTLNFLNSSSIKLVPTQPAPALQKARQKRGKPPLPGWYEIVHRRHVQDYSRSKVSKNLWKHSYRYDVGGHFRHHRVGRCAGRVSWIPDHQRGLANTLYKPAVRVAKGDGI